MTDRFTSNPYIFSAAKPNINKTQNFLNRVSNDSSIKDNREAGAASFKQVMRSAKNTKNQVQVEFEAPDTQKLSPSLRPGHRNSLWSKA